jgi:plastocyanin
VRTSPSLAQPSSSDAATAIVRVQKGAAFSSACLTVEVGATVEWRNLTPSSSIIVLSVRDPYEMSSPSLMLPYNVVPTESSDECTEKVNGSCVPATAMAYSYWRHTFTAAGIFDYVDQAGSSTTGGGTYSYGLPAGPTSSSGGKGTICVRGDGVDCGKVCCAGLVAGECGPTVTCVSNRCGGVIL